MMTTQPLVPLLSLFAILSHPASGQAWTDLTAALPVAPKVGVGQSLASDGSALYALATPNGVLRSTDDGASWSAFHAVSGGAYELSQFGSRSIDAVGTTVWAGGEPGGSGASPLHRTTAPTAWTPTFAGAPPPAAIDAIAFDSSTNTHWAAGRLGGIFKSTDGGGTWTAANGDLPGTNCASIVARNGTVVAAILGTGMGAFTSTDGGITWQNNGVPLESIGFLAAVNDNLCVRGGASNDSRYFSSDFGRTWQATTEDTAAGLRNLVNTCADGTTLFAGGTELSFSPTFVPTYTPKVAFSRNGGITWDDLTATGLPLGPGKDVVRLCRHRDFLFALTGENRLYRLDLAAITLTPTLKIAVQPRPNKQVAGGTLTMKVQAGGPGTLTYQWKKDGDEVAGQTTDTLSITNAQAAATGNYTCVVTAGDASVTSAAARGTVVDRIEGRYDPTYDRTTMAGGETGTPFLQSDGSLVVITSGGVYRLGPHGGKTGSRAIGGTTGYNGRLVDAAGRILLGGIQGSGSTHRVRRLLGTAGFPDDATFPQLSANNVIRRIVEVPGTGYLVAGDFTTIGPVGGAQAAVTGVSMVNYDGTVNTTFNANLAAANAAGTPYVAPDNTIWMVGAGFKKVTATGEAAAGFTAYSPVISSDFISSAQVLNSGKLLVTLANSGSRALKLFNPDGTVDNTFNSANLLLNQVFTAATEQADGRIIIAGNFTTFGSNACNGRYLRLSADGVFDSTFYNASGFSSAGCSGLVYDPRGYVFMANAANNPNNGSFQDSSTMGDTIGQNFVRVFATPAPASGLSFAAWASGIAFPAGQAAPADDPDHDGFTNLEEFAFGADPLSGTGAQGPQAGVPVVVGPDTFPSIAFTRRQDATGITLSVEADGGIPVTGAYPTSLVSTTPLGGGLERVVYRSNVSVADDPSQFLRVRISVP
jgi:hypothetical protein